MEESSVRAPVPGRKRRRRLLWIGLLAVFVPVAFLARPGWHLWRTARHDVDHVEPPPAGFANDASRMNLTAVRELRVAPADTAKAEQELAALLAEAEAKGWKVSLAGARHSMGGHTMYPGGIVVDMRPLATMELDEATNVLHVGAGALWHDVLTYLDLHGRSVGVMQSNNSFTVGGSISVNCHGWQVDRPPIASTVRGYRLMKADGSIVQCRREENAEMFSAALGGYGLFGIILDVELATVPNRRYKLDRRAVETPQLPATWDNTVAAHPDAAEMVYGRLNVMASRFLEDALVYVMYVDPDQSAAIPTMHEPESVQLRRNVFRGAAEDEYGKKLRWQAELKWQPKIGGNAFSRNQLLNEGVEIFQNRSDETTDILHEYFVPRSAFGAFVERVRTIVPKHDGNLLNVTVRSIETDTDTQLRYASEPVYSLVMLFQQARDELGDEKMAAMTRELIDAALEVGGRYYLPYRLHATREQFRRAYPQADAFFALKRKYDPHELFQNQFYLKYGATTAGTADTK
jgi:FAD/FMN-containing dehydrogenase